MWLIFSKLKLAKWGWAAGTVTALIGGFILATFLALFNYLTPSGRLTVTGRVVEVTPNVTGQIISIPVKPNMLLKKNDVLFQIDPAPFQYKVTQLQASLAGAKQDAEILKANYDRRLRMSRGSPRRSPSTRNAMPTFRSLQRKVPTRRSRHRTDKINMIRRWRSSTWRKRRSRAPNWRLNSEIGGVNTTVAQTQAQLTMPSGEVSQTTLRAPDHGYVTVVALAVGDRALQARSAMSFIVEPEITLVGMFSQNGFQTIKEGAPVDLVFDNIPGRILHAKITAIPKGIGQGQIAASGTLARTNALGGATVFPAEISIPDEMSREALRLGMSGSATVFSEKAGVIGLLASILVWISSYTAYM